MSERFKEVIAEMEKVAKELALSQDVIENAEKIIESLHVEKFGRGYDFEVGLVVLYYTMKIDPSCPAISLKEFAEKTPCVEKKYIARWYRRIVEKLGIPSLTCTVRPKIFVEKFGGNLGLSKEALGQAVELAEEIVEKKAHLGRNPISLTVACIWIANLEFSEGLTEDEIVNECGTTENVLRQALEISFFAERRLTPKRPRYIKKEVLIEFIPKLLKLQDEKEIPFLRLRSKFRSQFPDKTKGFRIPTRQRLIPAVKILEVDEAIILLPNSECEREKSSCRFCDLSPCFKTVIKSRSHNIVP